MEAIKVSTHRLAHFLGWPILILVAICFIAVIVGFSAAIFPGWFVLSILLLPGLLVVATIWPEIGLLGLFALVCGLVPVQSPSVLSVGGGSIRVHEFLIIFMALLAFAKQPSLIQIRRQSRALLPIYLLMSMTIVAVLVAVLFFNTTLRDALSDSRNQLSWFILLITVLLLKTRSQITRFVWLVVALGVVVSLFALMQFITGMPLIRNARVEELSTLNQVDFGVTRSIVGPSIYFSVFSMMWVLGLLITKGIRLPLGLLLLAILMAGVVVTFGRGVWMATILAALFLAFRLSGWRGVRMLVSMGALAIAIGLGGLALYKPNVVPAVYDRFTSSTKESFERNTTLGWRVEEAAHALSKIKSYPIFGIGLGTAYKPVTRMNGISITENDIFLTKYIHNSYLGLWLKFGILGVAIVAIIVWANLRRSGEIAASVGDVRARLIVLCCVSAFLVPVFTSITQPEWLSQVGIAFLSLMIALPLAVSNCYFELVESKRSRSPIDRTTEFRG